MRGAQSPLRLTCANAGAPGNSHTTAAAASVPILHALEIAANISRLLLVLSGVDSTAMTEAIRLKSVYKSLLFARTADKDRSDRYVHECGSESSFTGVACRR